MEKIEIYFLEKIKKVDSDFKKLYERITGYKTIKFKKSNNPILLMTTYIMCKNCNKKFKSPIQVEDLNNPGVGIENVSLTCPLCFQPMVLNKEDMINE